MKRRLLHLFARSTHARQVPIWSAAPAGRRRLLLHAGLHKTGTTALQAFLSDARDRFRDRGLLYPLSGIPDGYHAQHNVAWQLAGDRRFRCRGGDVNAVAGEIGMFSGDAILSSEDLESILATPERLLPLLRHPALADHVVTILFYVRDQATYAESLFFEMLRHGLAQDVRRFCSGLLAHGEFRYRDWTFHFDYYRVFARLSHALRATIVVRPLAGLAGESSISDFLAFIGETSGGDALAAERRANRRPTVTASLERFVQNRLRDDPVAPVIVELLHALGPWSGQTPMLSCAMRSAFDQRFASGNRRLARACGFSAEAIQIARRVPSSVPLLEGLFSADLQTDLLKVMERHPNAVATAALATMLAARAMPAWNEG
jgi:hypothetical protein